MLNLTHLTVSLKIHLDLNDTHLNNSSASLPLWMSGNTSGQPFSLNAAPVKKLVPCA